MPRTSLAVGSPQNSAGVLEFREDPPKPQALRFSRLSAPRGLARALSGPGPTSPPAAGGAGCDPAGCEGPALRVVRSPAPSSTPTLGGMKPAERARRGGNGRGDPGFPDPKRSVGAPLGWDAGPAIGISFGVSPGSRGPFSCTLRGCRGTGCLGGKGATFSHLRRAAVALPGARPGVGPQCG